MKQIETIPAAEGHPRYLSVIRNGQFVKLWLAQVLSQIAPNLLYFALILRVFDLARGTSFENSSVGLLVLFIGIPAVLFSNMAGVFVDHGSRRSALTTTNVLRAILVLGFLFIDTSITSIFVLTFVVSSITQFFVPAEAASIPRLVTRPQLLAANSMFIFTLYSSMVVGYSAAAPLINWLGKDSPYYIASVMFILAAALCAWLPSLDVAGRERARFKEIFAKSHQEIRSSWRTIIRHRDLYFPITQLAIMQAVVGVLLALAPKLSELLLGVRLKETSHILIIPTGIGMIAGAALVGRVAQRINKTAVILAGSFIGSAGLIALSLSRPFTSFLQSLGIGISQGLAITLLVFMLGTVNSMISVAAQTVLHETASDEIRGKVFGALNMLINIAATLPIFIAGSLADAAGADWVIGGLGAMILAYTVILTTVVASQHLEQKKRLTSRQL